MTLMKAVCPKCSHIVYTFELGEMSPETVNNQGFEVKCPFHGTNCVTAPAEVDNELQLVCGCGRCMGQLRKKQKETEHFNKEMERSMDKFNKEFTDLI